MSLLLHLPIDKIAIPGSRAEVLSQPCERAQCLCQPVFLIALRRSGTTVMP